MIGILPCLCRPFSSDFYDEIRHASRRLFQIFCKAAKVFQMAPDDFARNMDMPDNLIPYLHKSRCLRVTNVVITL